MKAKKKLLLMGVGAMTALALGVGATSTFAWFGAVSTATAAAKTDNESITVTQHIASVSGVEVPLTVTLSSDLDYAPRLLEATYVDDAAYKNLQTGYLDDGGTFHPVTGANIQTTYGKYDPGTPEVPGDDLAYVLFSTLKVTIGIDFDAKCTDGTTPRWSASDGTGTFKAADKSATYNASDIIASLKLAKVDIGFKASGRGCLFESAAASGDENYTGDASKDTDTYYYKAANQGLGLGDIGASGNNQEHTQLIYYYIAGKTAGDPGSRTDGVVETANVSLEDVFSVKVRPHSA